MKDFHAVKRVGYDYGDACARELGQVGRKLSNLASNFTEPDSCGAVCEVQELLTLEPKP